MGAYQAFSLSAECAIRQWKKEQQILMKETIKKIKQHEKFINSFENNMFEDYEFEGLNLDEVPDQQAGRLYNEAYFEVV